MSGARGVCGRQMHPAALACRLLAIGCWACSSNRRVDKPAPPDMSALIWAYDHPSGTLDATTLSSLAQSARDQIDQLTALGTDTQLIDDLRNAVADIASSKMQSVGPVDRTLQTYTVQGDGYMVVTRICDGWGDVPVADRDANGALMLTLGFTESGVDPVIWGNAEKCLYRVGTSHVSLDGGTRAGQGDLRLYVGNDVTFAKLGTTPILFDLDIAATIDGRAIAVKVDFRYDPTTQTFELRFDPGTGSLIAFASAQGLLGVRAKNGQFTCDIAARTCQGPSSEVLQY